MPDIVQIINGQFLRGMVPFQKIHYLLTYLANQIGLIIHQVRRLEIITLAALFMNIRPVKAKRGLSADSLEVAGVHLPGPVSARDTRQVSIPSPDVLITGRLRSLRHVTAILMVEVFLLPGAFAL